MRQLQPQVGVSWPMMSHNGDLVWQYITEGWAMHMWEFNGTYNLSVRCEETLWLLPQQGGNKFIMEEIGNLNGIKPIAL